MDYRVVKSEQLEALTQANGIYCRVVGSRYETCGISQIVEIASKADAIKVEKMPIAETLYFANVKFVVPSPYEGYSIIYLW